MPAPRETWGAKPPHRAPCLACTLATSTPTCRRTSSRMCVTSTAPLLTSGSRKTRRDLRLWCVDALARAPPHRGSLDDTPCAHRHSTAIATPTIVRGASTAHNWATRRCALRGAGCPRRLQTLSTTRATCRGQRCSPAALRARWSWHRRIRLRAHLPHALSSQLPSATSTAARVSSIFCHGARRRNCSTTQNYSRCSLTYSARPIWRDAQVRARPRRDKWGRQIRPRYRSPARIPWHLHDPPERVRPC